MPVGDTLNYCIAGGFLVQLHKPLTEPGPEFNDHVGVASLGCSRITCSICDDLVQIEIDRRP